MRVGGCSVRILLKAGYVAKYRHLSVQEISDFNSKHLTVVMVSQFTQSPVSLHIKWVMCDPTMACLWHNKLFLPCPIEPQ